MPLGMLYTTQGESWHVGFILQGIWEVEHKANLAFRTS